MSTSPIQPDSEVPKASKIRWLALFTGNSLLLSILLHVIFAVGATYFIVEHFQKKHVNFQATEPPGRHTEVEHKVELAKKNNVESAPPDLKRITTTDISQISLPDVPETPKVDDPTPTLTAGEGDLGAGMGGGNGTGGDGGGASAFGAPSGDGFEGYFYDLKQNPNHEPTGMDQKTEVSTVEQFCRQGWNDDELATRFFRSPKPLFTNQILIPIVFSTEGPKAFDLEKICQPGYWVAIYHVKVKAARSGSYHLAGFGDYFLIARVNGTTVLDSGFVPPVTESRPTQVIEPTWAPAQIRSIRNDDKTHSSYQRTVVGERLDILAGDTLAIDVLIGDDEAEPNNGLCGFSLFLVEDGKDYAKDPTGFPLMPLLQIQPDPNVKRDGTYPPFTCKPEDAISQP